MLLDELAIKYQQESNEHREQVKTATRQHETQVEQLTKQIDELTVSMSLSPLCAPLLSTHFGAKHLNRLSCFCYVGYDRGHLLCIK